VRVERVPWAEGKNQATRTYQWFLSNWAKRLSWTEVGRVFGASWQMVCRAVEQAVDWGRAEQDLEGIEAIGVDEILHRRGSKAYGGPRYLSLVYQIDEGRKRLLWIGRDRNEQTLHGFFDWFGPQRSQGLRFICSDMWPAYLKVIRLRASRAVQILDRFHVMAMFNKAIDKVRASEARQIRAGGRSVLTNSRWLFLKRRENLSEGQQEKLAELLRLNLKIVRAYLLKESFDRFWCYLSAPWAGRFLDSWCDRAIRSRIEPMKQVAKSLRRHRQLLLNWFEAKAISVGTVEGLNNKAKVTMRKSYGFRSFRITELALYLTLGDLPQPEFTHTFW
jgi:transposase